MIYYIMGVAGSGKTTVGKLLAKKLNIPFFDGDDFHPKANVSKMSEGIPLIDADRWPWLQNIAKAAQDHLQKDGVIIACSALKESYRKVLEGDFKQHIRWIFLSGSQEVILNRMNARTDHFMPPALLQSQFDTLESPSSDQALVIDITKEPQDIVSEILGTYGGD